MMAVGQTAQALEGYAVNVYKLIADAQRRFKAPEFQRHYVWDPDDQIKRFWEDLEKLGDEGTSESGVTDSLFLGAVVLQEVDPGGGIENRVPLFSIIDGQQRLVTLYLVLTAIAEAFQDAGSDSKAEDIQRDYLLLQRSELRGEPRLTPTVSDTAQFHKIVSCLRNPKPMLPRGHGPVNHKMTEAWESIRKRVRSLCTEKGELSIDKIERLRYDVTDRVELVSITLGSRHDPHEVYERLNTGGAPLGAIDLARNAVFLTAGHDPQVTGRIYRDHWEPFEEKLGIPHQEGYFFPYALIRDPGTTKARAYRDLREYWTKNVAVGEDDEENAKKIVADIEEYLVDYLGLVGAARPSGIGDECWSALQRLRRMDVPTTMYPYLMRLIHAHREEEVSPEGFVQAINVIDSLVIRRDMCGIQNAGIHPTFRSLWGSIGPDTDALAEKISQSLQFPGDDEFRDAIKEKKLYGTKRCKYILTEYERSFSRGDPSEWDPDQITVDHLLPQDPSTGWEGVTKADRESLTDTWANLVPLSAKANSEKSRKSWPETRKMLLDESGTVFKSTAAVAREYERWDADAIRDRANKLAQWAIEERWPR